MIQLTDKFGVFPDIKKRYLIDTSSELSELETTFGNEAYCIADKKTYICNGTGVYVEKSSGGGGGSPQVVQFVTLTPTSQSTATADKTNAEIYALIDAGVAVKIDITLGIIRYTADVSTTAEIIDPEASTYGVTNFIAVLPNIYNSAFYMISTGDQSADNTNWTLTVVPFGS